MMTAYLANIVIFNRQLAVPNIKFLQCLVSDVGKRLGTLGSISVCRTK